MSIFLVALLLAASAPQPAAADAELLRQMKTCDNYMMGKTENPFQCANGKKYYVATATCTRRVKGLFFYSDRDEVLTLLCAIDRPFLVKECLADNIKNAAEIDPCEEQREQEHGDFVRASMYPPRKKSDYLPGTTQIDPIGGSGGSESAQ